MSAVFVTAAGDRLGQLALVCLRETLRAQTYVLDHGTASRDDFIPFCTVEGPHTGTFFRIIRRPKDARGGKDNFDLPAWVNPVRDSILAENESKPFIVALLPNFDRVDGYAYANLCRALGQLHASITGITPPPSRRVHRDWRERHLPKRNSAIRDAVFA